MCRAIDTSIFCIREKNKKDRRYKSRIENSTKENIWFQRISNVNLCSGLLIHFNRGSGRQIEYMLSLVFSENELNTNMLNTQIKEMGEL
jgi:hypothetical protein